MTAASAGRRQPKVSASQRLGPHPGQATPSLNLQQPPLAQGGTASPMPRPTGEGLEGELGRVWTSPPACVSRAGKTTQAGAGPSLGSGFPCWNQHVGGWCPYQGSSRVTREVLTAPRSTETRPSA